MATKTRHVTPGPATKRTYTPRDFSHLIGTRGFSEPMLRTHFELYEGYVQHTNKALELLRQPAMDAYAAAEVRRRLVWEFNGMRLHELYFDAMTPGGADLPDATLKPALEAEFGSLQEWWTRFQNVGALRGSGWAVLCYDPENRHLLHDWVNEHDRGTLAGTFPILVLDLFEHAYMRDYGTDRKAYLKAFHDAIDWTVCERRMRLAKHMAETVDSPAMKPATS